MKSKCPHCQRTTLDTFEQPEGWVKVDGKIIATRTAHYSTCWNPACAGFGATIAAEKHAEIDFSQYKVKRA